LAKRKRHDVLHRFLAQEMVDAENLVFVQRCAGCARSAPWPRPGRGRTAFRSPHGASDDIGGTVTSAKGPEAGVWVIAETKDLPTRYIKIVVTDDKGRYVLPTLPKAKYKVWVRGYGLVDSARSMRRRQPRRPEGRCGARAKDAAEYYPAAYWYAMLKPPAESEFPGTGATGNGIAPTMVTQQHWLENMKENCMFCHQLGDKATRDLADRRQQRRGLGPRIQMARADGDPRSAITARSLSARCRTTWRISAATAA
jgi:hypothetical protein